MSDSTISALSSLILVCFALCHIVKYLLDFYNQDRIRRGLDPGHEIDQQLFIQPQFPRRRLQEVAPTHPNPPANQNGRCPRCRRRQQ